MQGGGKRREPISLLLLKGKKHLTEKEIKERQEQEVKGKTDKVIAPSYLPKSLKTEFARIAKELLRIELISNSDVDSLARFIFAREQYVRLTLELRETDVLDDAYGKILNNQDKLFRQCGSISAELGLTISSRCRLLVPKAKKEQPTEFQQKFGAV